MYIQTQNLNDLIRDHNFAEAKARLLEKINVVGYNYADYILLVKLCFNTDAIDEAIEYANIILSKNNADTIALLLLASAYSNLQNYQKAYDLIKSVSGHKVPIQFIHSYCQATIKQGDFSKFAELGDFFEVLEKINPAELPSYLGINGLRNRVFDASSLEKYLALQSLLLNESGLTA